MLNFSNTPLKKEVEGSLTERGVIFRIIGSSQPFMLRVSQGYDRNPPLTHVAKS